MEKRILAVDDDNLIQEYIRGVLSPCGYQVTCVSGGQDAIETLKKQSFDCIILDFYMPEKDGLDVLGSMYRSRNRTPTIVFSSRLSDHYEAAVQGLGITREVLKKPCPASKLLETVERVISNG